jgi:UDP-perosamine 4-acetyltransferase
MDTDAGIIIGAGGHARVVIDALQAWLTPGRYCLLDDNPKLWGLKLYGVPIIGGISEIERLADEGGHSFLVAIGHPPSLRAQLFARFWNLGMKPFSVEHIDSTVAVHSYMGAGSVVLARASIGPNANIGINCIINTAAIVEHDVVVGRSVHVGPGAILLGDVTVGDEAFIGAGAVVLPGVKVGKCATVGAGAVVTRDVKEGDTVVGVPAWPVRPREVWSPPKEEVK